MLQRRRALLLATAFVAACGGATVSLTDSGDAPSSNGSDASTDAPAADASDARVRDVATDIPLLDERPCRDAGTLFECLDCCDLLYPPGQWVYVEEMDRCACESCPACAGSDLCIWDAGAPPTSSKCDECAEATRDHDGPTSCHPQAQEACDRYAGCIASQRCMVRSRCFSKPAQ